MTDDFISDFRDDLGDEEGPEWLHDLDDIEEEEGPPAVTEADDPDAEFDQLRQRSARASSAYDDVELEENGGSGFSLSLLTPGQRLVLAILLLLNVIVIIIGVLAMAGILQL